MSKLAEIAAQRRIDVAAAKAALPLAELAALSAAKAQSHSALDLYSALSRAPPTRSKKKKLTTKHRAIHSSRRVCGFRAHRADVV